ncbi:peptidoglycan-binding domain-containing protein [uncultured Roseibium sp.]|uniref:peptidoglycan-binding domain-containing protein n=1 Tax=uncultured Roseibium sp. TaxID=1936171 RepID=UPI003216B0CD
MFFSRKPILFSLFLSALGLPATSALADVWTFETPSKNIQCTVGEGVGLQSDITCTIIDRSGPDALPRPTTCNSDWGHTFSMRERGPVEILCQETDRSKGGFDVANYGVTGNFGGFTCHSSTQGLKCTNRDGNGFFLSRRQQTIIGAARQQADAAASPAPEASAEFKGYDEDLKQHWLVTEQHLQTLGFGPGPVDGMVEAATVLAVHAFQKAYGLKVLNQLPPEHFAILEALAKAKDSSVKLAPPAGRDLTNARSEATIADTNEGNTRNTLAARLDTSINLADTALHQLLIDQRSEISTLFLDAVSQDNQSILAKTPLLEKFLRSSLPFVSCQDETIKIVGFYNLAKGYWLNAYLEEQTVKQIYFAPSPSGTKHPDGSAWYDLFNADKSIVYAFRESYKAQLDHFNAKYDPAGCRQLSRSRLDEPRSDYIISTLASENAYEESIDHQILSLIQNDTARRHKLISPQELTLSTIHANLFGADFFIVQSKRDYPGAMVLQKWRVEDGNPSIMQEALELIEFGAADQ